MFSVRAGRLMYSVRRVSVTMAGIVLVGACARAAVNLDDAVDPVEWDRLSAQLEPCLGTPPFLAAAALPSKSHGLRNPRGSLPLPSDFVEQKTTEAGTRLWVAPDSSRVEVTVSDSPNSGVSSSVNVVEENKCHLRVAGYRARTVRLRIDDEVVGRSTYVADATAVPRVGVAMNVWIAAPTALRREELLRAVSAMRISN